MEQQKFIIAAVIVLVILGGLYWTLTRTSDTAQPQTETSSNAADMNTDSGVDMNAMLDDETTVMVMGGAISPALLYVAPGQEVRILNHERTDLQLMFETGTETETVPAGGEGSFTAPLEPGSYSYHSSENDAASGRIVVETQ